MICNCKIWDLVWNVRENVNKANTLDGSNYDSGTNPDISSSNNVRLEWTDGSINTNLAKNYTSAWNYNSNNGIWKLYQADWTIFIRGGAASNSSYGDYAGVFTLHLCWGASRNGGHTGFRCAR